MKQSESRRTEIDAYAKVNFSIDVLGKDAATGLHRVDMILQTIPLCDRITIVSSGAGTGTGAGAGTGPGAGVVRIQVASDDRSLPQGEKNIAWRAVRLMLDRHPEIARATDAIRVFIQKKIPVGGGLGGSSADGAGVLKGLNVHFGLGLSVQELMHLGAELGSDVPFQVLGGAGLASGTGTEITPLPPVGRGFLLICMPEFSMMTREVYQKYDTLPIPPEARPDTQRLCAALRAGDSDTFCAGLRNVLEIPAFAMRPAIAQLKQAVLRAGARTALMSGSGAAVFGLFDRESAARRAAQDLENDWACRTFICDISRLH